MKLFNLARYARSSKIVLSSVFVLALAAVIGFGFVSNKDGATAANGQDCSNNAIIKCGAQNPSDFARRYYANEYKDLPAVYNAFGLQSNELDRFVRTAKMGTAYKDGRIVVDGQTVATEGISIGRDRKTHSSPSNIGGKTYYADYNYHVFGQNSLPVMVMFDANGVMEFATLTACGNPITGKKIIPKYSCDMLEREQVSRDTYKFSTKATVANGAKIAKVIYEFGDGTKVEKTNPAEAVTHKYAKPGNYTAKVTVHVTVNGQTKTVTGAQCSKPVEVKPEAPKPVYSCDMLNRTPVTRDSFDFSTNATAKDGATIEKVVYDFGDGKTEERTNPSDVVRHQYANGNYTAKVTVYVKVGNETKQVTSAACQKPIEVKEEVKPVYSCDAIKQRKISDSNYGYTVDATAKDGATISKVVYTFSDGETKEAASASTEVTKTFEPGEHTITATLHVSVNGETKQVTSDACKTTLKIAQPVFECTKLVAAQIGDAKDRKYRFTVTVQTGGGATFKEMSLNFGDNQTATVQSQQAEHQYVADGDYTAVATVKSNLGGTATSEACKVSITIKNEVCPYNPQLPPNHPGCKPPVEECKPGIPVGDDRCKDYCKPGVPVGSPECEEKPECKPGIPMNDARCEETPPATPEQPTPPAEIPATGAGAVVGGVVGLSSIAAAGYYYVGSRRNFLSSLNNR